MGKRRWKLIAETDNYFEVSQYGEVRRVKILEGKRPGRAKVGQILKARPNPVYLTVWPNNGMFRFVQYVHILVAQYFLRSPPKKKGVKYEVNHKDLDKLNNYYRNLEWVTDLQNKQHARRNGVSIYGAKGELNPGAKLSKKQVRKIRKYYKRGKYNQYELADKFNVTQSAISYIVNNKVW